MNVYEVITDRILKQLESGTVPWHQPWTDTEGPRNLVSQKPYRGINVWMLASAGYPLPYWLTYKQAANHGGHVRAGEHGMPVVFWKTDARTEADADTGETTVKSTWLLRYYTVFNLAQIDGMDTVKAKIAAGQSAPVADIPACEQTVASMPNPPALTVGDRACYRPSTDTVMMPSKGTFESSEAYYSVLFHELGHATGHSSRLDREGIRDVAPFGSQCYSKEELVAEMTAAYLCGTHGIADRILDQSAAYIAGWLTRLRSDVRLVVQAGAAAQKAADYIRGV